MESQPVAPQRVGLTPPRPQVAEPRAAPQRLAPTKQGSTDAVEAAAKQKVVAAQSADEATVNADRLEKAVKQMNQVMDALGVSPRFEIHESTDELQVVLANRDTGEVIRKIPPDEVLERRALLTRLVGATFDVTS